MYHRICTDKSCKNSYCISSELFENDLKYLKAHGYESVFASSLADGDFRGKRIVVITFDDGYKSDIELAVPLLEKYGFCASFYIFGGAVGTENYLTEDDIRLMSSKSYIEIGNHTYMLHKYAPSTLNLLYSNPLNADKIFSDFDKNSAFLKSLTGKEVITATYPNGEYSTEVDLMLKSNGIKTTFSTEPFSFFKILPDKPAGRKTRSGDTDIESLLK